MTRYYVEMTINFDGWIEADSKQEAEQLAWTSWGDTTGDLISYNNVDSITVEEDPEEEEEEDE